MRRGTTFSSTVALFVFWITILFPAISCLATVTTTDDGDGVPAATENLVPNANGNGTGDGNGDGIQDYLQSNVTSLRDITASHFVTLSNSSGFQQTNVRAVAVPSDAPRNVTFPYGMFQFQVTGASDGATVTMTILIPKDTRITGYWKKNRNTGTWQDIATSVVHGPAYAPGKTVITFAIRDGGPFDEDGHADGSVTDQGGPGTGTGGGTTAVPAMKAQGMILLSILILGSVVYLRRRGCI